MPITAALLAVFLTAAPDAGARTLENEVAARWGEAQRPRIARGISQVRSLWRKEDGSPDELAAFVRESYLGDPAVRQATFERLERVFEQVDGHFQEMSREMRVASDLDVGPILPVDPLFAGYDPSAHVTEDLFANKLAFVVLLNFPLTTLEERLEKGPRWSRQEWAEARLASRFRRRLPADVQLGVASAGADAEAYISGYNVYMHHLVGKDGSRLFPKGLRLISHWNLRDDLKARYAEKDGLAKQRMIAKVMERIVTQTIPRAVVDDPRFDWDPFEGTVRPAPEAEVESGAEKKAPPAATDLSEREQDTRYAKLLGTFRAARRADPFSPSAPTLLARRFDEDRELPEPRVEALLVEVLGSPLVPRIGRLIEKTLGRPLEPFDIWFNGFGPRGNRTEAELDAKVSKRYPTKEAYAADIPRLLRDLGFSPQRADYVAGKIAVDPSRGAGHAMPAARRGEKVRLRTRVEPGGMNYKGYNIAVHEMGHNVEQVFSLYEVDHTLLAGVPNNAFTEALAFVFQRRDLTLLGLPKPDEESERRRALHELWQTFEIAGPALVDTRAWHYMYDHPDATPAELRDAVVAISKDVWNRYYAPIFETRDSVILGIYSHTISLMNYLPDYVLGHLIDFQIEEQMARASEKGKSLGEEFERMTRFGSVTPDLWMVNATGSPVSA
ncbi:MAG TPA: hypothetical protein VKF32_15535, partial [Thermoanaerobaculia bacterium]|nr:hypothetical protein [Thermoanaerobaculia bacterium]